MYFCLLGWGEVAVRLWQALVLPSPPSAPPKLSSEPVCARQKLTSHCKVKWCLALTLHGNCYPCLCITFCLLSWSMCVHACTWACTYLSVWINAYDINMHITLWGISCEETWRGWMWVCVESMPGLKMLICASVYARCVSEQYWRGDICRNAYLTTDMKWGGRNFWFAWFLCRMNFGWKTERKLSCTSEETSKLSPLKCPILGLQQVSRIWPSSRNWLCFQETH